jgi:hypothetical protein
LISSLKADKWFDSSINQEKLHETSSRIKTENPDTLLKELMVYQTKTPGIGFPSSQWFSDHLPVGALLNIKRSK